MGLLSGVAEKVETTFLNEITALEAMALPERFRAAQGSKTPFSELSLTAYAIARLDYE